MGKRSKRGGARGPGDTSAPAAPPARGADPTLAPEVDEDGDEESLDALERPSEAAADNAEEGEADDDAVPPATPEAPAEDVPAEAVAAEVLDPLPPCVAEEFSGDVVSPLAQKMDELIKAYAETKEHGVLDVLVGAPPAPTPSGLVRCRARTTVQVVARDEQDRHLRKVKAGAICFVTEAVLAGAAKHLERL